MTALRNILRELVFQFKISGALRARLHIILRYYGFYWRYRRAGLEQGESRLRALSDLNRSGLSSRKVEIRLPDGRLLELNLEAAAFMPREFLGMRMYEEYPGYAASSGQTVVDVGAHQGMFATSAANKVGPKGRVVAVEAHPGNFELLSRNKEKNRLDNLTLVRAAAFGAEGEASFYVTGLVSGGHSLFFRTDVGEEKRDFITVRTRRLDDILAELGVESVDLLKVDVEGAVMSVFDGAQRVLAGKPRIVMEVEGGQEETGPVRRRLETLGYRLRGEGSILYAEPAGEPGN